MTRGGATETGRPRSRAAFARASLAVGLLAVAACRTEVQLDPTDAGATPRDAARTPRDAALRDTPARDTPEPQDAPIDAALDAPPPLRPCEGTGLPLGAIAMREPPLAPSIVALGTGADRRHVILVPPSARPLPGASARLLVLDANAATVVDRELAVATGGAALVASPLATGLPGEAAVTLLLGDQWLSIDRDGADVGTTRALPEALDEARQAASALVASDRLLYVGVSGRIVSIDPATGAGTASAVPALLPTDRLFVGDGSIVVNRGEPTLETWELAPALDGTEAIRISFPDSEFAGRALGAYRVSGERRWVVKADGEFRAPTHVSRVGDDGTFGSLADELLIGPLTSTQRDGLVTIRTSDGRIVAADVIAPSLRTLVPAGPHGLAAAARGEDGEIVLLTLEDGDPDPQLVFRCGL